jgi:hypothetical protein
MSLRFKFKELNEKGQETGLFSKKGEITDDQIVLDGNAIPLLAIAKTARRANRLILVVATKDQPITVAIAITSGKSQDLKQAIDGICSSGWARMHREEMEKNGKGALFRSEPCPYCRATVDLSGFEETPQMYCPFCETVVTRGPGAPRDEKSYRLCDKCGYYSQPKGFTVFYFIFLLVAYHFQYRTDTRCNACMRSEAWKMFFGNLIFVLGFPFALVQLLRAYFGGSTLSASFSGLDAANRAAQAGRREKARALYDAILARLPQAAGVRLNRSLMCLGAEPARAAVEAHAALKDCSNYAPAADAAIQALAAMGKREEAEGFQKAWGGGL